ncbi:UNVERIFIED_CONTAM: hypothetical protein PYX00_009359 [Menopon gallinae]|uniref:Ubiquitin fusion degradation protein 1 homolog n=1 Tax=Menopon gallinae TaxID=328185 RepID=A0AAW2HAY5_9NEOP
MFDFRMYNELRSPFNVQYRCYSISMLPGNEREDVERGGKIIMPPSALETLARRGIDYPILFKLTNKRRTRITHCGVLEFVADEEKVYLPYWMMRNLLLEEGDPLTVESVQLPVATFSRFQPQSEDFLDITNPQAVLENCLRSFACLTTGDIIAFSYNSKIYEVCVLETQPGSAVSIIECDMTVEFAPPLGYKEPKKVEKKPEDMAVDMDELIPESGGFVAFKGTGNRLDGKKRKETVSEDKVVQKPKYQRGIPDFNYKVGTLKFMRNSKPPSNSEENEDNSDDFQAFTGRGFSLKDLYKK